MRTQRIHLLLLTSVINLGIKKIKREQQQQLYGNTLSDPPNMKKFLETRNNPTELRINKKSDKQIISTTTELVIKRISNKANARIKWLH